MAAYYVTTPIYYVNDAPHIGHGGRSYFPNASSTFPDCCALALARTTAS